MSDLKTKRWLEARNRLALAIGHFSMAFAQLEQFVNHSIWVFLDVPTSQVGQLVTGAIINVSTRLDILSSMVRGFKMEDPLRSELNECIATIRLINTYRNWLLHDVWGSWDPTDDSWSKMKTKTEAKFRMQFKKIPVAEIDAKTMECKSITTKLQMLVRDFDDSRAARPT